MSAPFGASVAGVRNLVITTAAAEGVAIGSGGPRPPRVSDDTVAAWLEAGGSRVLIRIAGWEALPPVMVDTIEQVGKDLTQLYAASLLADVTHPERAGVGGKLGDTLMSRYQTGLNELSVTVAELVSKLDPVEDPSVGSTDWGAMWNNTRPADNGWLSRGF